MPSPPNTPDPLRPGVAPYLAALEASPPSAPHPPDPGVAPQLMALALEALPRRHSLAIPTPKLMALFDGISIGGPSNASIFGKLAWVALWSSCDAFCLKSAKNSSISFPLLASCAAEGAVGTKDMPFCT
eukprot:CAMPEP_0172906604 /NCGR_PEP_ID=MMETSP1075-20121228/177201_1 /TAXON_ID=2916 /ORGANISM="Ceratium fusus, Strain PA161109" /LENGTH=128 /DNA_ID=CAMNT_0013764073 /DNA_START=243 /DNA_END=629 /DNA_ORIENTATION=+